jgi:putative tricarboxylic transport membrane protein
MKIAAMVTLLLCCAIGMVHADGSDWQPKRRVELVVGNGAGGELDRIARALQQAVQVHDLSRANLIVVNRPGAGQMIGVAYLNDHPGDPQYLAVLNKSWLAVMASHDTPNYPDVTPIAVLYSANSVFAVNADSPIKNGIDLLNLMRKNITSVSFAFEARGGVEHAAIIRLAQIAGADPKKLKIVIFEDAAKSALAVAGDHVDVYISSIASALPLIQAGKLRAIGIAGPQRLPGVLSTIPTFREQGIDILSQQAYFVVGPKGLTPPEVAYWQSVLSSAVETSEMKSEASAESWHVDFVPAKDMPAWLTQNYQTILGAQRAVGYSNQ